MEWKKALEDYDATIEEKLKEYFDEIKREARHYHPFINNVYSNLEEYVLRRGKRLASCSTFLTYKGYTDKVDENILRVCIGIEIFRHCILIHDDLVDMDTFRRGGKTIHQIFIEGYDSRFGDGVAVFLGNIAFSLASQAIISSGFPIEKTTRVSLLLSKGYKEVNESQILDLLFEHKKNVNINEWQTMASKRAASLFKVTMLTGGILGGASEKDLKRLEEAAVNIGYAFDIQDDIIDTFADEKQYGRPPCRDIILGKKPLHVICTLNSANQEGSRALSSLLGRKSLNQEDISLVRDLIRKSGGLETAKSISKNHAETARMLITQTNMSDDVKEFFRSLISYIEESLEWYK